MEEFIQYLRKNKKWASIIITLLLLVQLTIEFIWGPERTVLSWVNSFSWFIVLMSLVHSKARPDDVIEDIYLLEKNLADAKDRIETMDFIPKQASPVKTIFLKRINSYRRHRIKVVNQKVGFWKVSGRKKYLRELYDLRM